MNIPICIPDGSIIEFADAGNVRDIYNKLSGREASEKVPISGNCILYLVNEQRFQTIYCT